PAKRSDPDRQAVSAFYRGIAPEMEPVRKKLADLDRQKTELTNKMPKTLVTMATAHRVVRILPRGNWLNDSGDIVSPAIPAFLPAMDIKDRRANRLDLAKWLTDRKNPLVARVFVNRLWVLTFGQGLVKS